MKYVLMAIGIIFISCVLFIAVWIIRCLSHSDTETE